MSEEGVMVGVEWGKFPPAIDTLLKYRIAVELEKLGCPSAVTCAVAIVMMLEREQFIRDSLGSLR